MISDFRRAAMRAILMFHSLWGSKPKMVPTNYNLWKRRRAIVGNWTEVVHLQPDALPLSQTGPLPPTPLPLTIFLVTVTSPRVGLTRCNEVVFCGGKLVQNFLGAVLSDGWLEVEEAACLPHLILHSEGDGKAEDTSLLVLWQSIRLSFI